MEEGQAITLLKQGDLAGLEVLVLRYQVVAVQTAYLIVGDRSMAEDIAQAAFLKAAERIHQFKDGRPFRPWILRIVTNDAIKASSRSKRHLSLDAPQELGHLPAWLRDTDPGPEELANTAENRRMVWEALQQLTTKQRAVVVMRYFLDMKDREISRELNRPLSSVKWSIHAAKGRLRSILGFEDVSGSTSSSEGNPERGAGGNR
ncbi:MAG TPA: RNA polymerase sigma factor [Anaerolineae bacterium]|nr:RNA polymerase sigma factor [Anaerolineae bacterium]